MAARPACKYGASCYRKNPDHLKQFSHPGREKVQQGGDGGAGRDTTPSAATGTSIEKGVTQSRNKAQRNAKVSDPSLQVIYNFLTRLLKYVCPCKGWSGTDSNIFSECSGVWVQN